MIRITVKNGVIRAEVNGTTGPGCVDRLRQMLATLQATPTGEIEKKPEFYQEVTDAVENIKVV